MTSLSRSRIFPAIAKLVDSGREVDKNIVAQLVHCDPKTASRYLFSMYMDNNIYISRWERNNGSPTPFYKLRNKGQKDAVRPEALSPSERTNRRRKDSMIREQEAARKRFDRRLASVPRLGMFGI